jgi:hypothetical protein
MWEKIMTFIRLFSFVAFVAGILALFNHEVTAVYLAVVFTGFALLATFVEVE